MPPRTNRVNPEPEKDMCILCVQQVTIPDNLVLLMMFFIPVPTQEEGTFSSAYTGSARLAACQASTSC